MNWFNLIPQFFISSPAQCSDHPDNNTTKDTLPVQPDRDTHKSQKYQKVPNYEQYFSPVLMVTQNPELIKGFKFQIAIPLSEYFHILNTWTLPNTGAIQRNEQRLIPIAPIRPNYTLTAQLLQDIKNQQPLNVMMGKIDNEGKLDAMIYRKLMKNISLRLTGSFQSSNIDKGITSADIQLEGKSYASHFRIGTGQIGFDHMQKINQKLMIGFDYANLRTQRLSFFGYGAKLQLQNHSLLTKFNGANKQFNLGYIIPIKQGTQFIASYILKSKQGDSVTTVGFKQSYSQSSITATINTKGLITTCLCIKNPSFSVRLSALVDYMKQNYNFGYGVTLGHVA